MTTFGERQIGDVWGKRELTHLTTTLDFEGFAKSVLLR